MTLIQTIASDRNGSEFDRVEPLHHGLQNLAPVILMINPTGKPQSKIDEQLRRLGFKVEHIREHSEALDVLDAPPEPIEVVVLDWRSEEPKSRDFAEALAYRSARNGVPVLTLAAASRVDDIQLAFEAGLSTLVTAPCQLADLKTALDSLMSRKRLDLQGRDSAFSDAISLLENCKFRFRTPDDVQHLVPLIARIFPQPERAASGIFELMMNAIEHGNLEIGHDRKAEWVSRGVYRSEMLKRLEMPPYSTRWAEVTINRRTDGVMIVIMDQGCGFCWQDLVQNGAVSLEAAGEPSANGLTKAKRDSFDDLRFNQFGNQVTAFVSKESHAW